MVNATAVWRQRPCDKTAEVPRCCSDIFHREWLKKTSSLSRTMISRRSLRRVFSFTEDELVSSKIFWKIKGNFSAPHTFCKVIATPLAMEVSKASSVLRAAQTDFFPPNSLLLAASENPAWMQAALSSSLTRRFSREQLLGKIPA